MKILINLNTFWNIYNFRKGLSKYLLNNGYKVYALAPEDSYKVKLEELGVKCIPIHMKQSGTNPVVDAKLLHDYYKVFKSIRPDIILSYTIKPNIYGNIAAGFLTIPVINNISGLGTLFIKESIASKIARQLYKFSLKFSSHVFFQNKDDRQSFIGQSLVQSTKSSVIPGSGVNVDKFYVNRQINKGDRFLFVGRLIKDKGVLEYLEAAKSVLTEYPNKEFILVGELGYDNKTAISKEELQAYTQENENINFIGKTDNIIDVLKEVDVMVLPSYREGLSKSLIEAASMQLPIITTNVPGCREVIEDKSTGFLCEVKSIESLTQSFRDMINLSEADRLNMGIAGRERVKKFFSEEKIIRIYNEKIDLILKKK